MEILFHNTLILPYKSPFLAAFKVSRTVYLISLIPCLGVPPSWSKNYSTWNQSESVFERLRHTPNPICYTTKTNSACKRTATSSLMKREFPKLKRWRTVSLKRKFIIWSIKSAQFQFACEVEPGITHFWLVPHTY